MKPAAAFSVGLWTGAAVVAAVGLVYVRSPARTAPATTEVARPTEMQSKTDQIFTLQQENTRQLAEIQRLKETVADLKSNIEERAVAEAPRRTPFVRFREAAPETTDDRWIEEAVARGDAQALPKMEALAVQNNRPALEGVALLADLDGAEALLRVWQSPSLTLPNRLKVARYLAANIELNPEIEDQVRAAMVDARIDVRLLYGIVDGLANPSFAVSLANVPPPPHFRPDFQYRVRLLDYLRTGMTDERLRAYTVQAREELLGRWAQAEPVAPGTPADETTN